MRLLVILLEVLLIISYLLFYRNIAVRLVIMYPSVISITGILLLIALVKAVSQLVLPPMALI